ncbi:hypothetical protein L207DRAFT_266620 [Hyaloscypha variabilis F]|uniref:RBR-type E3 ubiquitin transferase n=1 Tax=Hyaloscypha variabilis (strain UAMH 11265 / GT02V1 / F) TaxID=1149755 RepID=A0A2J6RZA1_HYAVF|nr:hypothetical protein L207DRAFT_266620 [Hyaloscypha variabilis F]
MKMLRRLSSKLGLGKKDGLSMNSQAPYASISEDPSKNEHWPAYDPTDFENLEQRSNTGHDHANTDLNAAANRMDMRNTWGDDIETAYAMALSDIINNFQPSSAITPEASQPLYGGAEFELYGPQYGLPEHFNECDNSNPTQPAAMHALVSDPYEEMMQEADAEIQRVFLESLKTSGGLGADDPMNVAKITPASIQSTITKDISQPLDRSQKAAQYSNAAGPSNASNPTEVSRSSPGSCIICTEDFTGDVWPPALISMHCLHPPSVCCVCLEKYIKNELDSKIWNQIKCPECPIQLVYEDIKRLADEETFSRYDVLSFRSAMGTDKNFVWCQNCDFGQLHASGASQPIIRCLKCGHRSCFQHSVAWHDRLTCDEYDEMLADPDGFQSAIDKEEAAAAGAAMARKLLEEEDALFARELENRDRRMEEERQRQRHEEERKRAQAAQQVEAQRIREEQERAKRRREQEERERIQQELERRQYEEEQRRVRAAQQAQAERDRVNQERARQREEIKKRAREDKLSVAKVHATTKQCPGCRWPIEKNDGCSHMTCIKCQAEFCWSCLSDYKAIRQYGNTRHKRSCEYHTNNLPS